MTGGTALKTIFKLRDGYELTEEEAAHFDIDGQLVIEVIQIQLLSENPSINPIANKPICLECRKGENR